MNLVWSATPGMRTACVSASDISNHFGFDDGDFMLTVFCLDNEDGVQTAFWQIEYDAAGMLMSGESPNEALALLDVTIALFTRVREIVAFEYMLP